MPITTEEFEAGVAADTTDGEGVLEEAGPLETEKKLITSFLSERHDQAFTAREIVLGVDFSPAIETYGNQEGIVSSITGNLTSGAGDVAATAVVVDDVDEALGELVDEGMVVTNEVTVDGESTTFYRLA